MLVISFVFISANGWPESISHVALTGVNRLTSITKPFSIVICREAICSQEVRSRMISVSHLVKKFGDFTAVNDISFDVAQGEIFAFLGPNGAGKTTTIKMLTTLLRPTSGTHRARRPRPATQANAGPPALRHRLPGPQPRRRTDRLGKHGAARRPLPRAAQDPRAAHRGTAQALRTLGRAKTYVKKFSGGMKRRLEIARGFLHTPKILFLDEPTLGLDPQSRNQLWTHVKQLNETEKTSPSSSPRTTWTRPIASPIASPSSITASIVAQGTPAELKQQTGTDSLEDASSRSPAPPSATKAPTRSRPDAPDCADVERQGGN